MLMSRSTYSINDFGMSNTIRNSHNKLACKTPINYAKGIKQHTIKLVQKKHKKNLTSRLLLYFLLLKKKRKKPNYQRDITEMAMKPIIELN